MARAKISDNVSEEPLVRCPPCADGVTTMVGTRLYARVYIKLAQCERHLELWDQQELRERAREQARHGTRNSGRVANSS